MKIVKSNGGQLCNRIWSYLFLIAHSIHFKEHIFMVDFDEYMPFFQNLTVFPKVHFVKSKRMKAGFTIATKCWKFLGNSVEFDLQKRLFFISVNGWEYRSEIQYLERYKKDLLLLFSPNDSVIKKCQSYLSPIKEKHLLVGVHIRHKDYKSFFDGAYYFENNVYKQLMEKVQQIFSDQQSKEICFLLCSDEKLNPDDFSTLNCIQIPDGIGIDDLYGLSLCDYIIGPPSTFSMWASFYGHVPLKIIDKPTIDLSIDQFKVISAVDKFADGSEFIHNYKINDVNN